MDQVVWRAITGILGLGNGSVCCSGEPLYADAPFPSEFKSDYEYDGNFSGAECLRENLWITVYCPYDLCYPQGRRVVFGVCRKRETVLYTGCGHPARQFYRLAAVLHGSSEYFCDDAFSCSHAAPVLCSNRFLAAEHTINGYRGLVFHYSFFPCIGKSEGKIPISSYCSIWNENEDRLL